MKVQEKVQRCTAHISSGVVIDMAAFKVSHCVNVHPCVGALDDIDTTALQVKKQSA